MSLFIERCCHFSPCRRYRYALRITWDIGPPQMFIGLNPSTADEYRDDPTVRRCIDFSRQWGRGGLIMANAFAFRATDPRDMFREAEPIGEKNTWQYLRDLAANCAGKPIAAWGRNVKKHPRVKGRQEAIMSALMLDCLGLNRDGTPVHPLYLAKDTQRIPFNY